MGQFSVEISGLPGSDLSGNQQATFYPQRPKLSVAIVELETRAAMAEGWNPESRGRGVHFIATTALELGQQPAGNPIALHSAF